MTNRIKEIQMQIEFNDENTKLLKELQQVYTQKDMYERFWFEECQKVEKLEKEIEELKNPTPVICEKEKTTSNSGG